MAAQFENFIQLELPKRPYLAEDVPEESVIVRRGPGPRQLGGVQLTDGQVLGMQEGQLLGLPLGAGSTDGFHHEQAAPSSEWVIQHNRSNRKVVITILDTTYKQIFADEIVIESNQITISFIENQAGFANIVFL